MTLPPSTVYLATAVLGALYALVVHMLRRADPQHGITPWLVVVGDGLVIAAYGVLAGSERAVPLLILFTLAGAPMIVEYHYDRIRRRRADEAKSRDEIRLDM